MPYSDVIDSLNPNHRWSFESDSTDQIGSSNGTDNGVIYTNDPLCEGVTNCMTTTDVFNAISIPTTTDINNSAQSRKAVAGWFNVNLIQTPPKRIYGEGNDTLCFQFVMSLGNVIMFEVVDTNFTLQIYGIVIQPQRNYHLCGLFEGNGYDNKISFYIDGVEQTRANPPDRQPDQLTLSSRGVAEFGDPVGTVGIGGDIIILNACVNGKYNEWSTWDGANAVLSGKTIREELFEKGTLPDYIISGTTESACQTLLDNIKQTKRKNASLCIRVNGLTGGGDFTLTSSGVTFDELSSIHVQYTGVDTLTWRNDKYSDASIFSTTSGGTISVFNQTTLTIMNLQNPTEIRVYDAGTTNEIAGVENVTTGTFSTDIYENSVDIAIISIDYIIKRLNAVDTSSNVSLSISQFKDNVYYNE